MYFHTHTEYTGWGKERWADLGFWGGSGERQHLDTGVKVPKGTKMHDTSSHRLKHWKKLMFVTTEIDTQSYE